MKRVVALSLVSAALAVRCVVSFEEYPLRASDGGSSGGTGGAGGGAGAAGAGAGDDGSAGSSDGSAGAAPNCRVWAGYDNSCARRNDLSLWCWGGNDSGQIVPLADASNLVIPAPVNVLPKVSWVALGRTHTCAVVGDRRGRRPHLRARQDGLGLVLGLEPERRDRRRHGLGPIRARAARLTE